MNHTEIIGKIKKIYIYIKYKDFWEEGGGGVGLVVIIIVTARIIDMECRSSVSGIDLEDLLLMSWQSIKKCKKCIVIEY